MEICRYIYLNKLISKKHNGLIKVVTGMRRCGKSYLLFNLFKDHLIKEGIGKDHILEIFNGFRNNILDGNILQRSAADGGPCI